MDSGYSLISWFAAQSEIVQIALSLVVLLMIAPSVFAVLIVAVTKIEARIERWLTSRADAVENRTLLQSTVEDAPADRDHQVLPHGLSHRSRP
jgi:hypothetical protein